MTDERLLSPATLLELLQLVVEQELGRRAADSLLAMSDPTTACPSALTGLPSENITGDTGTHAGAALLPLSA
jgi:hypothetical protein